jgi:iron complex transport system ATP-binding protein
MDCGAAGPGGMSALVADQLTLSRQGRLLVDAASLALGAGELVALIGPNGAGKSTLLRLLLGLAKADSGRAAIDGADVATLPPLRRAALVSYLPQQRDVAWPLAVGDVVALGRFAHGARLGRLGKADAAAVARALAGCGIAALADRRADTLSGGEAALMHLARVLAAETPLVVADEPVNSLDPRHQHRVLGLFRDYVTAGNGALVVLHDLALAARYADRLIWMQSGRIVADGPVTATMTEARIAEVYGVVSRVVHTAHGLDVIVTASRPGGDLTQV